MHHQMPLPTLCLGTFDSEKFWQHKSSVRLPAIKDSQQESITTTLDELLFPFCPDEQDILLTSKAMTQSQKEYLHSLGFNFQNSVINRQQVTKHISADSNHKYKLSPYSILPDEKPITSCSVGNPLPHHDVVKKVNSKIYSWQLRRALIGQFGELCYSSEEIDQAIRKILNQGGKALLKEEYGVSGKGTLLIEESKALERIIKYIQLREKKGSRVAFIVEPLLDKTADFSCHIWINETGEQQLLSIQKMKNRGFSFKKIEAAEQTLIDTLDDAGYFQVIANIGKALFNEGYHGPVCIDSMLTNSGVFPLVEINARKSMGLINHQLTTQLGESPHRNSLTFYNLRVPHTFSHQMLLERLESGNLLFNKQTQRGVIPLNATGLTINLNASTNEQRATGRLYCSIFTTSQEDEKEIEEKTLALFKSMNLKVY